MKPTDKIKKAMSGCHAFDSCSQCPYFSLSATLGCKRRRNADALALIQQLEAQNVALSESIKWMEAERDDLKRTIRQLEAERDAAVKSLRGRCFECKHNKTSVCLLCSKDKTLKYWEWRGVQKEESDA